MPTSRCSSITRAMVAVFALSTIAVPIIGVSITLLNNPIEDFGNVFIHQHGPFMMVGTIACALLTMISLAAYCCFSDSEASVSPHDPLPLGRFPSRQPNPQVARNVPRLPIMPGGPLPPIGSQRPPRVNRGPLPPIRAVSKPISFVPQYHRHQDAILF